MALRPFPLPLVDGLSVRLVEKPLPAFHIISVHLLPALAVVSHRQCELSLSVCTLVGLSPHQRAYFAGTCRRFITSVCILAVGVHTRCQCASLLSLCILAVIVPTRCQCAHLPTFHILAVVAHPPCQCAHSLTFHILAVSARTRCQCASLPSVCILAVSVHLCWHSVSGVLLAGTSHRRRALYSALHKIRTPRCEQGRENDSNQNMRRMRRQTRDRR